MGLKRGRPVQFHRPLVGPQKGRLPLLVPWGQGPSSPAWFAADQRSPCQGLGVRPRRYSGRQLAHRRKGRGHRRSPTSLLRGHDPRQEDPYPGQVRELQPISQIASQSPFSSGPAGAGPNPAGSCRNEAGIPEAQPEGRAVEFRRLQAPGSPSPPCYRRAFRRSPPAS